MSKIKNGGLDQYGAGPLNSSDLEQLALKGLSLLWRYGILGPNQCNGKYK